MDLEAEVKALETKLRGICAPEIYLEPRRFLSGDPAVLQRLVGRILQSGPVEVQQQLVEEGSYTPLCHFVGEDWYAVFSRFLRDNLGVLAAPGLPGSDAARADAVILPWDQWKRRSFSAVKVREVALFADIVRRRVPRHRNLRQMETERLNRLAAGAPRTARASGAQGGADIVSASSASVFGSSVRRGGSAGAGGVGGAAGEGEGASAAVAAGTAASTVAAAATVAAASAAPGVREACEAPAVPAALAGAPAEAPAGPHPQPPIQEAGRVESYQLRLREAAEAFPGGASGPPAPRTDHRSAPRADPGPERPSVYQLLLQVGHAVSRLDEKLEEVLRRLGDLERRVSHLE